MGRRMSWALSHWHHCESHMVSFSLQAGILPPCNLPPKATDWIWTFLPRDLLAAHPLCTFKSIKCLCVMFCIFNQCY